MNTVLKAPCAAFPVKCSFKLNINTSVQYNLVFHLRLKPVTSAHRLKVKENGSVSHDMLLM